MLQPLKINKKVDNDAKVAQIIKENIPTAEYMSADEVNAMVAKINEMVPAINVSNGGFQGTLSINEKRVDSGFYIPQDDGKYINAGDVVVDRSKGIHFVTFDGDKWDVAVVPIVADGKVEEGNVGFVSGGEVYGHIASNKLLSNNQNLSNVNLFNKVGYYLSKNNGNESASKNRKCTPFLFINLLEDLIITGYDGSETENTSLCNFYNKNKVFLGVFSTGELAGHKENVLISKEWITSNFPTAMFVRCSASIMQTGASVYGITNTNSLNYYDDKIDTINTMSLLLQNVVPDSSEDVTIANGRVIRVRNYTLGETPILLRQIDYTYDSGEIVEIRQTVKPYLKLQIKTNLSTLKTETIWL